MRILLGALPAYMAATGWGWILAGVAGGLVSIAVLAPFTILGVLVLESQREKHRHEDQWRLPVRPARSIDR
jgi:hypothetical protein